MCDLYRALVLDLREHTTNHDVMFCSALLHGAGGSLSALQGAGPSTSAGGSASNVTLPADNDVDHFISMLTSSGVTSSWANEAAGLGASTRTVTPPSTQVSWTGSAGGTPQQHQQQQQMGALTQQQQQGQVIPQQVGFVQHFIVYLSSVPLD